MTGSTLAFRVAFAVSVFAQGVLAGEAPASSGVAARAPYIQNLTTDGITVMWRTPDVLPSELRVRPCAGVEYLPYSSRVPVRYHELKISGLKPSSCYEYSVLSGTATLGGGSFTTMPAVKISSFTFAVWGDSQHWPQRFSKIASGMLAVKPAFAVAVGDYEGNGSVAAQWEEQLFVPGRELLSRVPVFFTIGNHDYGFKGEDGDYAPDSPGLRNFTDSFRNPAGNRTYYSFDYGNSHFIVLDAIGGRTFSTFGVMPGTAQYDWLLKDLASSRSFRHVFVFLHAPPYSVCWDKAYYDGEPAVREHLVPLFEKYGVRAVFSGHSHAYERGSYNGVGYIVTGGGGGTLDDVIHKEWKQIQVHFFEHHFMKVSVEGESVLLEAISPEGKVLDSFSL